MLLPGRNGMQEEKWAERAGSAPLVAAEVTSFLKSTHTRRTRWNEITPYAGCYDDSQQRRGRRR